jgi:hypothetical protein
VTSFRKVLEIKSQLLCNFKVTADVDREEKYRPLTLMLLFVVWLIFKCCPFHQKMWQSMNCTRLRVTMKRHVVQATTVLYNLSMYTFPHLSMDEYIRQCMSWSLILLINCHHQRLSPHPMRDLKIHGDENTSRGLQGPFTSPWRWR